MESAKVHRAVLARSEPEAQPSAAFASSAPSATKLGSASRLLSRKLATRIVLNYGAQGHGPHVKKAIHQWFSLLPQPSNFTHALHAIQSYEARLALQAATVAHSNHATRNCDSDTKVRWFAGFDARSQRPPLKHMPDRTRLDALIRALLEGYTGRRRCTCVDYMHAASTLALSTLTPLSESPPSFTNTLLVLGEAALESRGERLQRTCFTNRRHVLNAFATNGYGQQGVQNPLLRATRGTY